MSQDQQQSCSFFDFSRDLIKVQLPIYIIQITIIMYNVHDYILIELLSNLGYRYSNIILKLREK